MRSCFKRVRCVLATALGAIAWLGCVAPAPAQYSVDRVVGGLNQPMFVTQAPGDGSSLYIVERNDGSNQLGRVRRFDLQTQTLSTFVDVTGGITSDGGLLSMEFHPDYQSNGLFYITSNVNGSNRLDEYKTVSGTPAFQRRLVQYNNLANVFHTINQPFFRPGGDSNELFLTTGDGGTQADQGSFNPALIESPTSVYGKVIKIDLSADFSTPAGDLNHAGASAVALGIRNPYRSGFDRETGDFYFGDVGFNAAEEVNIIPASHFANPGAAPLDFGWTSREGTIATIGGSAGGPGSPGDIDPLFEYAHGAGVNLGHPSALFGQSITGGYVYRGSATELQGRYFFSDFVNGRVYSGEFDNSTPSASFDGTNMTDIVDHTLAFEAAIGGGANLQFVSSFGEDNAGNLYIVKFGNNFFPSLGQGEIFRISAPEALNAVVDRTTGAITLTNESGTPIALKSLTISSVVGAIDADSLTPITGNYDLAGDESIDDNNAWTITSPPGSSTLFSESSTGDPGLLGVGQPIVLSPGQGWVRSPHEDLAISLLNAANEVVNANVSYAGNGGDTLARSDLNFDGQLTTADWGVFVAGAGSTFDGLSVAQSYGFGDLDGDGDNDFDDFMVFKSDYIAANGAEAFASLSANVPEPLTLHSGLLMFFVAVSSRRRWMVQCD